MKTQPKPAKLPKALSAYSYTKDITANESIMLWNFLCGAEPEKYTSVAVLPFRTQKQARQAAAFHNLKREGKAGALAAADPAPPRDTITWFFLPARFQPYTKFIKG